MVTLVANATGDGKEAAPDLAVDGELQFDAAVAPEVREGQSLLDHRVRRTGKRIHFPLDINAGNIGYKIAARLG